MTPFRLALLLAAILVAAVAIRPTPSRAMSWSFWILLSHSSSNIVLLKGEAREHERKELHAAYAAEIGPAFKIIGTRDFVMLGESYIAGLSHLIRNEIFNRDEVDVPSSCQKDFDGVSGQFTKAYLLDGHCRFFDLSIPAFEEGDRDIIFVLYDIQSVQPAK